MLLILDISDVFIMLRVGLQLWGKKTTEKVFPYQYDIFLGVHDINLTFH